ncbi:phosphodiester glycosidase family protein [Neorhizobium sp. NPDC001467]|uniref:phosphodiester glycosidase family protein n=1 Tax=Neorhizobium sp. NPDC001467 TaxID=3390595 RepID=UPI003D02A11B
MNFFRHWSLTAALLLAAAGHGAAAEQPCERRTLGDAHYVVCTVKKDDARLRLFWQKPDGAPYRWFGTLAERIEAQGRTLVFAMNAGMYGDDFTPMGVYVEEGRQLRPADLKTMDGPQAKIPNFYKQPNGVFYFGSGEAGILTTAAFLKERPKSDFATQSGPMLVTANEVNPIFIAGSSDRTRRSGVGVCAGGDLRFVISEDDVNFFDFAAVFKNHLSCPDALFLDGGQGAGLFSPALKRADWSWHGGYGPMIGLVE